MKRLVRERVDPHTEDLFLEGFGDQQRHDQGENEKKELHTSTTRSHLIARWDEMRIQLRFWWQHNV
jgi:hypothetical protein